MAKRDNNEMVTPDILSMLNYFVMAPMLLLNGYLWWVIKQLHNKVENQLDKHEIIELVDYKLAPLTIKHSELKEDVTEIKLKLDEILTLLLHRQ